MSPAPSSLAYRIRETLLTHRPHPRAQMTALLSTLMLVLVTSLFWQNFWGLDDLAAASNAMIFKQHQWWRAWSATLVHADVAHLMSNSLLFFVLGYFLSGYFGLLMFPFLTFLMGGLINLLAVATYAPQTQLLGASGMVYWMGGVWLSLYLLIDRRRELWSRSLRVLGVALLLFVPSQAFDPTISYRTHFIGFSIGVVSGFLYFWTNRVWIRRFEVIELIPDEIDFPPVTADPRAGAEPRIIAKPDGELAL